MSIAKLERTITGQAGITARGNEDDDSRHLRVVHDRKKVDQPAAERAVRDLLLALGRDPSSPHLADTPRRVARSFTEMLTPREFDLTTFPNDEHYDELVLARDIPVQSLCEHHMLPFTGVAHVGYLPGERILGLSKLARVVELFSRDLQVQERLTVQVSNWLQENLAPRGVGVVIEAEHMCMSLRGVQATGSRTITSSVHGVLREDGRSRQEFFTLTRGS
jgi:GTP cyclohydrolase IA